VSCLLGTGDMPHGYEPMIWFSPTYKGHVIDTSRKKKMYGSLCCYLELVRGGRGTIRYHEHRYQLEIPCLRNDLVLPQILLHNNYQHEVPCWSTLAR
jgi:hypothetical protein